MKYNDLPDQGKEEIQQLIKAQLYAYYGEDAHGLLLDNACVELNPNITLFIDLKKVDKIRNLMIEIEHVDDEILEEIEMLPNGDILIKADNSEQGGSASD